jgi:hypothetical protein
VLTRALAAVVLLLTATPAWPDERGAYDAVRRELVSRYGDWFRAAHDPAFPKLLNRAWSAVGDCAAVFLTSRPQATPGELADAIKQLNPRGKPDEYELTASAVQLASGDRAAYAVSASFPWSGTFFVVARGGDGRFRVRWNIKELAARHAARHDEIANWGWLGFPWGGGPLIGEVAPLSPSRSGHPRFYVNASAAAMAGGTWIDQISFWEWDGRRALPLFLRSYGASFDTRPNELAGDTMTVYSKGQFKTFFSCGGCVEPEVAWRLQVTPDGIRDLGRRHLVPELQTCDELFDRIIRGKSASDIASPRVRAAIHRVIDGRLGMLEQWHVSTVGERRVLDFDADNLNCMTLHLVMEQRARGLYVSDVRIEEHCK